MQDDLSSIRNFTMFVLAYAGFFRYDDLSRIRRSHIFFNDDYMRIRIISSKNDQYRQGADVYIAESYTRLCPVRWLKRYLTLSSQLFGSDKFIFRSLRYDRTANRNILVHTDQKITYTRLREIFKDVLLRVGRDPTIYGLHSLRAGGVTAAVVNGINRRLYKLHGRWSSDCVDNYIVDSIRSRLSVSRALAL